MRTSSIFLLFYFYWKLKRVGYMGILFLPGVLLRSMITSYA
jgi:hypothetical protein